MVKGSEIRVNRIRPHYVYMKSRTSPCPHHASGIFERLSCLRKYIHFDAFLMDIINVAVPLKVIIDDYAKYFSLLDEFEFFTITPSETKD